MHCNQGVGSPRSGWRYIQSRQDGEQSPYEVRARTRLDTPQKSHSLLSVCSAQESCDPSSPKQAPHTNSSPACLRIGRAPSGAQPLHNQGQGRRRGEPHAVAVHGRHFPKAVPVDLVAAPL
jgi:hypothetical protein